MKTVHIITRLIIGGAQENTVHTCEDQHALHGDDVTLIIGPETGPEGSLLERARAAGFEVIVLDELRRSIRPATDLRSYRKLTALLREIGPEIVHTHSSKAGILGRAAAKRARLPCVHTIHGAAFHYGQSRLAYQTYVRAEKWAAKKCPNFISVCDAMTDAYVEAGIAKPEQFTTVYSGFNVEPFLDPPKPRDDVRSELGLGPDDIIAATVARLFHLKGHETLLDVAPRIAAAEPRLKFLWIGDGVLRDEYQQRIDALGLTDRFVFTGLVPPTRIPELMHAADMVVHPSQWEGLARVLPQGLIAGKPCISYDVGGASEVTLDSRVDSTEQNQEGGIEPNEETGRLLELNDSEGLGNAILELAANPDLRTRMGHNGRELCRELFDHREMTKRIREVYARVIHDHFEKK